MYKKRLKAIKVLENSKKPFFRLRNTRFLASKCPADWDLAFVPNGLLSRHFVYLGLARGL